MSAIGPFVQTTFFNASITQINGRVGWGSDSSEMTVQLAEDKCRTTKVWYDRDGIPHLTNEPDTFRPPRLGKPGYLKFGTFQYGGILESWEQSKAVSGGITYTCRLSSPNQILAGAQVILKGYDGSTEGVPNLFNISRGCSEAGLTWGDIRREIHGAVFYLRGKKYLLDVSEIPYTGLRFTGDTVDVMSAINTAAKNLGKRIFVELIHNNSSIPWLNGIEGFIKIRTSSITYIVPSANAIDGATGTAPDPRLNIGIIADFAGTSTCTDGVSRQVRGIERADEISNSFLVGDNIKALWNVCSGEEEDEDNNVISGDDYIQPFWGYHDGTTDNQNSERGIGGELILGSGTGNDYNFTVSVKEIDFAGRSLGDVYNISVLEIRAALYSFESWYAYLEQFKPSIIRWAESPNFLNVGLALDILTNPNKAFKLADVRPTNISDALKLGRRTLKSQTTPIQTLYNFVKKFGDFYGNKFIAALPNIECCIGDRGTVNHNWEATDAAWAEGPILGLAPGGDAVSVFKTDDGRTGPILKFLSSSETGPRFNLDDVSSEFIVTETLRTAWVKADFEEIANTCRGENQGIGPLPKRPAAVMSINGAVTYNTGATENDEIDLSYYLWVLMLENEKGGNLSSDEIDALQKKIFGGVGGSNISNLGLVKQALIPDCAAVPLVSTTTSYGPWYATQGSGVIKLGVSGRTHYERNTNLNPWTYGSAGAMNHAAQLTVQNTVSDQQVLEQGSITAAGGPTLNSLGKTIQAGGPNLTGIDIDMGIQGVTTGYRFRTHVKKFDELVRNRLEWMERVGQNQQAFQRALSSDNLANRKRYRDITKSRALKTVQRSNDNFDSSQHDMLIATSVIRNESLGTYTPSIYTSDVNRFMKDISADDDDSYVEKAGCDWSAIIRPYNTESSATTIFPKFTHVSGSARGGGSSSLPPVDGEDEGWPVNARTLNPFKTGHDMDHIIRNETFPFDLSINAVENASGGSGYSNQYRPMGLRGPIIIAGWGFDLKNKPVPSNGNGGFSEDYLSRPQDWKVGPLDVRWDEERGVWTSPAAAGEDGNFKIIKIQLDEPLYPLDMGIGADYSEGALATVKEKDGGTILIDDYFEQAIPKFGLFDDIPSDYLAIYDDHSKVFYPLIPPMFDRILQCRVTQPALETQKADAYFKFSEEISNDPVLYVTGEEEITVAEHGTYKLTIFITLGPGERANPPYWQSVNVTPEIDGAPKDSVCVCYDGKTSGGDVYDSYNSSSGTPWSFFDLTDNQGEVDCASYDIYYGLNSGAILKLKYFHDHHSSWGAGAPEGKIEDDDYDFKCIFNLQKIVNRDATITE